MHVCVCMYICMYLDVCILCVCMFICMCNVHMYIVYICLCIYVGMYMYTMVVCIDFFSTVYGYILGDVGGERRIRRLKGSFMQCSVDTELITTKLMRNRPRSKKEKFINEEGGRKRMG